MELHIKSTKQNVLLARKELKGDIHFTGATPSNDDVQKSIGTKLSVAPEMIAVKQIKTANGMSEAHFSAYAYDSVAHKDKVEPKKKAKVDPNAPPAEGKK